VYDSEIRVFARETKGEPKLVFNQHQTSVAGMVHLFDDAIASLGHDGKLITWHASSRYVLSEMKSPGTGCENLVKTEDNSLVFLKHSGTIHVASHFQGREMKFVSSRNMFSML